MINLEDYKIFKDSKKSLKELSKDDSNNDKIEFMTESEIEVIDFDSVKTKYTNELQLSEETAKSVDALTETCDGLAFVEFKNGNMKNEKAKVKEKIRDSLLLFCDITNKTVSYTREKMDFVLVYNIEKNPLPNQVAKNEVRDSVSREAIAKYFLSMANKELIRFDLERFQTLYFKNVHTYSKAEFDLYWKAKQPVVNA